MTRPYWDGTHEVTIHKNPLNDGTAWYRVVCSCGWANADQVEGGHRIYREATAQAVADAHRKQVAPFDEKVEAALEYQPSLEAAIQHVEEMEADEDGKQAL